MFKSKKPDQNLLELRTHNRIELIKQELDQLYEEIIRVRQLVAALNYTLTGNTEQFELNELHLQNMLNFKKSMRFL